MIQWLTWWRIYQWLIHSGSLVAHFQFTENMYINRDFLYYEQ